MNTELYHALGIDENQELPVLLGELEQKQFAYLEQRDKVVEEAERHELENLLLLLSQEIAEVKENIEVVNRSIVFDDETEEKGESLSKVKELYTKAKEKKKEKEETVKKKQEEERVQKEKEKEITEKIEGIKKKEEDLQRQKLEQELRALERAEEKNKQKQSGGENLQVGGGEPQDAFSKGLTLYKKQDYAGAFAVFKQLAEEENVSAQYMISNMYRRGEGVAKNEERAEFWMKKAADMGDASAQMDYGVMCLSDGDADAKKQEKGMQYLGMAADQENVQAMSKYIEVVKKKSATKKMVSRAVRYCDRLIALADDSYDAQKHEDEKRELLKRKNDVGKVRRRCNLASLYTVIGSLMIVVAFLYIVQGVQGSLLSMENGILIQLPAVSSSLIVPVESVVDFMTDAMSFDGIFGLELLLVGRILFSAGKKPKKKRYAEVVASIHRWCIAAVLVWYSVLQFGNYGELFTEESLVAIVATSGVLIAGSILGWVFAALTGTRTA